MNDKYSQTEINEAIERYTNKCESVAVIAGESGIPRSTIYRWIKKYYDNQSEEVRRPVSRNVLTLENKVKRLEGIIEILQSVECTVNALLKMRLSEIERLHGQYSVHMLCDVLKVSRGTFYNHILRNKRDQTWYAKRRKELRIRIQEIYDDIRQIFGAAKITAVLKEEGYRTSVEMVRQLMQDMGLVSIRQDAKDLYDKERKKYKNYLNQQFHADRPNQIWGSDVTYFNYDNRHYYICVIIDLYARAVVGHRIGCKNSTQLVKSTFKQAYESRNPGEGLLFHTDRGSNYRSKTFCEYLSSLGVTQSFSRAYVPYDNSVMESFFASLKKEELYRTKYRSEKEFRAAVGEYMKFYNEKRLHAKNGYKTPSKKEEEFRNNTNTFGVSK